MPNVREFRVNPTKRREFKIGDVVGIQGNQKLLAKGTRNGQVAWKIHCTACGTSPGLITEEHLDSYRCPSSICTGTGRIQSEPRRRDSGLVGEVAYQPVRKNDELRNMIQQEQKEQERQRQMQLARQQAQREAAAKKAQEQAKSNAKIAKQAFHDFHANEPGTYQRGQAILAFAKARNYPQTEQGLKAAVDELLDVDLTYAKLLEALVDLGVAGEA